MTVLRAVERNVAFLQFLFSFHHLFVLFMTHSPIGHMTDGTMTYFSPSGAGPYQSASCMSGSGSVAFCYRHKHMWTVMSWIYLVCQIGRDIEYQQHTRQNRASSVCVCVCVCVCVHVCVRVQFYVVCSSKQLCALVTSNLCSLKYTDCQYFTCF